MLSGLFAKLILSIIFGATIGLERESSQQGETSIVGIRTFALISLTGALAGVFFTHGYLILSFIIVGGFLALLVSYYIIGSSTTRFFGLTTELSALITFIIGLLLVLEIIPLEITVAIFVILIFIMSM